jgi:sec-independent protein translocase protein TatA
MNLGFPEIIGILILALLLFGPKKLPELGKSLGQGLREFRKSTQEMRADLEDTLKEEPAPARVESRA